ncbi:MAG: type I-B CRISPR-associated protein Cas7/Cst2/DevR [Candidatus Hydrothermae bacterium]|nr:type I-B CRISPR-associated protein Cas7/Cst2/DevR [Candidatus Hydrothermae bacterium]
MTIKAIAIGYVANVSAGNVNASHTEGNVMVTKKITLPDGSTVPYISGQAIRRMFRDRLEDLGWQLSEPFAAVDGQEVVPPVQPWKYIDEDLFGYMDTRGNRRRTSPVRVSSVIGLFRYQGDRDLGTRSFEKFGKTMEAGGNMFETEIYANLFKGNILIELDRVGFYLDREVAEKGTPPEAPNCNLIDLPPEKWGDKRWALVLYKDEKTKRLESFYDSLIYLWGGGRTARMLVDLSPKFVAIMGLNVKHPVFLEALQARFEGDNGYVLDIEVLTESIKKFEDTKEDAIFGLDPGFFANEDELKAVLSDYGDILTTKEAINKAKTMLS